MSLTKKVQRLWILVIVSFRNLVIHVFIDFRSWKDDNLEGKAILLHEIV